MFSLWKNFQLWVLLALMIIGLFWLFKIASWVGFGKSCSFCADSMGSLLIHLFQERVSDHFLGLSVQGEQPCNTGDYLKRGEDRLKEHECHEDRVFPFRLSLYPYVMSNGKYWVGASRFHTSKWILIFISGIHAYGLKIKCSDKPMTVGYTRWPLPCSPQPIRSHNSWHP